MDSIKELFEYEELSNKSPLLNKWTSSISNESYASKQDGERIGEAGLDLKKLNIKISPFEMSEKDQTSSNSGSKKIHSLKVLATDRF